MVDYKVHKLNNYADRMILTEHQQDRLNTCLNYLREGDRVLIKGSAGTGKTTLVRELIKQLLPYATDKFIYCTAPTNKAVSVLKNKVAPMKQTAYVSTHKALKMKRLINEEDGEFYFEPSFQEGYEPLKSIYAMVVDEASMINKELLKYIEIWADIQETKVIFLMDTKQLPPVNEIEMPVSTMNYPEVELTEIIRQKNGNPIIHLSFNLNLIYSKIDNIVQINNENNNPEPTGYVFSNEFSKIVDRLTLSNGSDLYKYIGYTNEEVDKMNSIVRNRIYGDNPSKIEIGETMIFDAPYGREYNTNEEIVIKNMIIRNADFTFLNGEIKENLSYYLINYLEVKGEILSGIKVIHEKSEHKFNEIRKKLKKSINEKKLNWLAYYNFTEQFAQLKYNHALTCHKAQGSTYQNVILNIEDFKKCRGKEFKHLLYTGITRASKLVVLYNPLNN